MPPVRTDSISALLAPDIYRVIMEVGRARPMEHPFWVNRIQMPWNPVTDRQVSGLSTVGSKPQGSAFPFDDPIIGGTKQYEAEPYGMAFEATFEAWDDELYGYLRDTAADLKMASMDRVEINAHNILNEAFVTTNETGFDGASLCSTAHTALDGRTSIANRPSTDVGFGFTAVQNAVTNFHAMRDERNRRRLMRLTMFVIDPSNLWMAREMFGSGGRPFTTDNELNSLVPEDFTYLVSHYLDTEGDWFGLAPKGEHDLNFMVRNAPMFDSFDDPRTKNVVFTVYQRDRPSTYGSYQGTYGSRG